MLASPLFGPDQPAFAGLDLGIRPALHLVPALVEEEVAPAEIPGQLCLSWNQLWLADAEPDAQQPSLLPEPPMWEELVVPRHVRATRGRSRSRGLAGEQLRLFG